MEHGYWNDWYLSWGWFLWFGIIFLLFSSLGNWRYTYQAHQNYGRQPGRSAIDILSERYARGEITKEIFNEMKAEVAKA